MRLIFFALRLAEFVLGYHPSGILTNFFLGPKMSETQLSVLTFFFAAANVGAPPRFRSMMLKGTLIGQMGFIL